jgi:hypothetical protein
MWGVFGKLELMRVLMPLTPYRIEDNLVITKGGAENLTTALKDPDEMERIISSS